MPIVLNLSRDEAAILMRWIGLAVVDARSHAWAIDHRDELVQLGEKLSRATGNERRRTQR